MSDKNKSDSKFFQILMAVITTIAAPVIVFMITNQINNNPATPTEVPTATLQFQASPTGIPVQPILPGINNPSGSIPAGVPALVDGLALTINAQDVTSNGQYIQVRVHIRNTGGDQRTLVFSPGALGLQDDAGHRYEPVLGDKKFGCKRTDLDVARNLTLDPLGELTLSPADPGSPGDWCIAGSNSLPLFSGPIEPGAKKLQAQINGLGPFQGFQVEIGL